MARSTNTRCYQASSITRPAASVRGTLQLRSAECGTVITHRHVARYSSCKRRFPEGGHLRSEADTFGFNELRIQRMEIVVFSGRLADESPTMMR